MIMQIDLLLDYFPDWLGQALIFSGIALLSMMYFVKILKKSIYGGSNIEEFQKNVVVLFTSTVFAISVLSLIPLYYENSWILIIYLSSIGKWLEGISIVRIYSRIQSFLTNKSTGGGSVRDNALIYISGLYISITAGSIGWLTLIWVVGIGGRVENVLLLWTISTLIASVFSYSIKLDAARGRLSDGMIIAMLLLITGAEVYNIPNLKKEIISFLILNVVYSVAFWSSILYKLRK